MSATLQDQLALPDCQVTIYPTEGGSYTFTPPGNLFAVDVQKSIRGAYGQFSLTIAPGGPNGINTWPGWVTILTPMSLVKIAMRRGPSSAIVMVGLVTTVSESQVWTPQGVQRGLSVVGADFGWMFANYCYYNLTYLLGQAPALLGPLGLPAVLSSSLVDGGTPVTLAERWYTLIMAGDQGILSTTSFASEGKRIAFKDVISLSFGNYPSDINIPVAANFLADEGSWWEKFNSFFPFPYYEMFIITAPIGTYATPAPPKFQAKQPTYASAGVYFVARANPLPTLTSNGSSFAIDASAWVGLQAYKLTNPFFTSSVGFSAEAVRNFYIVYPTYLAQLNGSSNGSISPFVWTQQAFYDKASINRYGYRPELSEVPWLLDPSGNHSRALVSSGNGQTAFNNLVTSLCLRLASYHEPVPLMASGSASIPLRPDILPGNRFTYAPWKNSEQWDFYVEGVSHHWEFSGQCSTTLMLSRGLPSAVYANPDLLTAIHVGNAMLQSGRHVKGLFAGAGEPLQPLGLEKSGIPGTLGPNFARPQAGLKPPAFYVDEGTA